jgi:hypothetical protein
VYKQTVLEIHPPISWITAHATMPGSLEHFLFLLQAFDHRCTQRGEGEEGGSSFMPLKAFETFPHKNAIKHVTRGPPRFSQKPKYPTQKNVRMTVHLCF